MANVWQEKYPAKQLHTDVKELIEKQENDHKEM